jgi:hypothetical protein
METRMQGAGIESQLGIRPFRLPDRRIVDPRISHKKWFFFAHIESSVKRKT